MKLADVVRSCKRQNQPFNDFISRFSRATKPRPQKLARFFNRLTSPLGCGFRVLEQNC